MAEILEGMTAAIALLTTAFLVSQWCVNKYRSVRNWVASVNKAIQEVADVQTQFQPNNGTSVHDRVQHLEETLRLLWASYPEGVYECTNSGEWHWVNRRMTALFGLDSSEMTGPGQGWLMAVDPENRSSVWSSWQESLANDIPYEDEFDITNRRTGERIRIHVIAIVHRDVHNKPTGYMGIVRQLPTPGS